MYDSIRAANIKRNIANPAMVAGYVDEYNIPKWTAAEWAMFPNAVKVRIAKKASTNDGHVLDVEPKLATPAQAPGWVKMRRASGLSTPTVYVNESTWQQVIDEFNKQSVVQPLYWIAHYDGKAELPKRAGVTVVAKQYLGDTNGMDYNIVADNWPGVDNNDVGGDDMPSAEEIAAAVWDAKILNKSNGNLDPASVNQMWTLRGVDVANDKLNQVIALLMKQGNVSAKDVADLIKPDFIEAVKEVATDVAHLDEDAVAEKLDELFAARLARIAQ
jgi:hypothetical protein